MFRKLSIENFKLFRQLEIDNLSRVNVFFGKNNCGKSTLLDALFVLSGISNPELFLRINKFRGYDAIGDVSYFFHNLDFKKEIQLSGDGDSDGFNRSARLRVATSEKFEIDNSDSVKENFKLKNLASSKKMINELVINAKIGDKEIPARISMEYQDHNEKGVFQAVNYKEPLNCIYLSPQASLRVINSMVSEAIEYKQDALVIDSLKVIDPKIKDFRITNNDILVDVGLEKRIPIQLLGDGVRKFFSLIIALYASRGGMLLVDEIDNGLHYTTMNDLWTIVLDCTMKFNVQLFVTTHDAGMLQSLKKILSKKDQEIKKDVSLYKLLHKDDDSMLVLHYDYQSFFTILNNGNEIR